MRGHRFGRGSKSCPAWEQAARHCLFAALFAASLFILSDAHRSAAQATQPETVQATQNQPAPDPSVQDPSNLDQPATEPAVPATAVPSPPSFSASQAAARAKAAAASESPAADHASAAVTPMPVTAAALAVMPPPTGPQDESQKAIYDSSANLLKLANVLKAEVDKTTADQLSVSVVRKAGEIEQLAHKMRLQ